MKGWKKKRVRASMVTIATDSAREMGGATLYGSLKWHPSSSACSIYSAINQRRVKQVTKGETSLVRLRLDKEIRPIRSSLDDEHDIGDDDDDVVVGDGPQGSHKICKDAPREVASALISAWTPLLLIAFSNADVLDAARHSCCHHRRHHKKHIIRSS